MLGGAASSDKTSLSRCFKPFRGLSAYSKAWSTRHSKEHSGGSRLGYRASHSGEGDKGICRSGLRSSQHCETPTHISVHAVTSDVVVPQHRPSRRSKAMLSRQHRPTSRPAGPAAPRPAGPKPARPHQGRSRPAGPGRRRLPGDGDVTTSPSSDGKGDVVGRRHRLSRGILISTRFRTPRAPKTAPLHRSAPKEKK